MRFGQLCKISVVIPTYNRARCLKASILSVTAQTHNNIEIVVVDDGSTDNTEQVVESVRDSRLRYIKLPTNTGASHARNVGIEHCTGDFIAFNDSDVSWFCDKLERQMLAYEKLSTKYSNVAGVYGRFIKLLDNGRDTIIPGDRAEVLQNGDIFGILLHHNVVDTATMILNTSIVRQHLPLFNEDLKNLEDWYLAIRLAQNYRWAFCDSVLMRSETSPDGINTMPNHEALARLRKDFGCIC